MKRFVIFGLLGPPIGFATFFWGLLQLLNVAAGGATTYDYHQVVLIPFAYIVGLPPAMAVAAFDEYMRVSRWRVLWTTLLGYAMGFLPILGALLMGFWQVPYMWLFGLVGAIPAMICSSLSGGQKKSSLQPG